MVKVRILEKAGQPGQFPGQPGFAHAW